jgi:4-carboxymuconolactone decarboxylase
VAGSPSNRPRLGPLPREEWTEEAEAAIGILPAHMQPPPGETINSLSVLARHPALAEAYLRFSLYLRFEATLGDRVRELLILRTAWLRSGRYELARHGRIATRIGFTDEELGRIPEGSAAPGWAPEEALLLRAVEELCEHFQITDATWAALGERYSEPQLMDIVMTVGAYDMLAMAFNTFGVEPEADLPPFPPGA